MPEEWLDSDIKQGLNNTDVEHRRKQFGWNEISTEKENLFIKFLMFFTGPVLYVMEVAVIIAGALRHWIDFGVIIGILFLNAAVGWYQEKQVSIKTPRDKSFVQPLTLSTGRGRCCISQG